MFKRSLIAGCMVLGLASAGWSEVISGVTATESSVSAGRTGLLAVNGAGLDKSKSPATHSVVPYGTTWVSHPDQDPGPKPWLRADLGKVYDLTEMRIWNYNEAAATDAGAKEVEVWVSADDKEFTKVLTITLAIATGKEDYTGEVVKFKAPTAARYVKIVVLGNHSTRLAECGLSEIQFEGTAK
jgi:hypothetical protein